MSTAPTNPSEGHTVASLLRELRDEGTILLRQEVALAKTELAEKTSIVSRNLTAVAIGGGVLFAGLIILLFGLGDLVAAGLVEAGLSLGVSVWLGPVIVGLIAALIGFALVMKAKAKLSKEHLAPNKTTQSLKEDKEWIQRKFQGA